jgi:hypothetical protein
MDFEQAKPMGRPTIYSDELANTIIDYLNAGRGLRFISTQAGMPAVTTIIRWRAEHPQFRQLYVEAREAQLELMAEDILDISDHGPNEVGRDKLRTDNRKWLLSKLARHTYGTTVKIEQAAPAPDVDYSKLSDEEFATVLALLEKAKRDGDAD